MNTDTCECSDSMCPVHKNSSDCKNIGTISVYRIDIQDLTGTVMCDGCADDALESGVFTTESEYVDEVEDEPQEPDEGDITTGDHINFFQYGKRIIHITHEERKAAEEMDNTNYWKSVLNDFMEQEKFWPNVWFISDHRNAHLISLDD